MTRRDDDPLLAAVTGMTYALEHGLDELRAQLLPTLASQPLQAALAVPLWGPEARTRIASTGGRLLGWSIAEAAGGGLRVWLRDSRAPGVGPIIASIAVLANASQVVHLGAGVSFVEGLTAELNYGLGEGSVWIAPGG